MDSKLARRMAYKKKLEEEYRQFQERCQVRDGRNLTETQIYSYQWGEESKLLSAKQTYIS